MNKICRVFILTLCPVYGQHNQPLPQGWWLTVPWWSSWRFVSAKLEICGKKWQQEGCLHKWHVSQTHWEAKLSNIWRRNQATKNYTTREPALLNRCFSIVLFVHCSMLFQYVLRKYSFEHRAKSKILTSMHWLNIVKPVSLPAMFAWFGGNFGVVVQTRKSMGGGFVF